jgi:hypothetical protein
MEDDEYMRSEGDTTGRRTLDPGIAQTNNPNKGAEDATAGE